MLPNRATSVTFLLECVTIRNVSSDTASPVRGSIKEICNAQHSNQVHARRRGYRCQFGAGRGRSGPSRADRICDGLILPSKGFPQALLFVRLPGQSRPGVFLDQFSEKFHPWNFSSPHAAACAHACGATSRCRGETPACGSSLYPLREIAGLVAAVQLFADDVVPARATSAGRARQTKDGGAVGEPAEGSRLYRGIADLGE